MTANMENFNPFWIFLLAFTLREREVWEKAMGWLKLPPSLPHTRIVQIFEHVHSYDQILKSWITSRALLISHWKSLVVNMPTKHL